jgi:hypothetical protein
MTVESPDIAARHLELWTAEQEREAARRGVGFGQHMADLDAAQQAAEAADTPRPVPGYAVGYVAQWRKADKAKVEPVQPTRVSRAVDDKARRREAERRVMQRLIDEELARMDAEGE